MTPTHLPQPPHPGNDVPDDFEPGAPPVEPDEGPTPAHIPDDPEHDRVIDPGAKHGLQTQRTHHLIEAAKCP